MDRKRRSVWLSLVFSVLNFLPAAQAVEIVWKHDAQESKLGNWGPQDLKGLELISSRERDPLTGQVVRWKGVSTAVLLDLAMDKLTIEQKAAIDLILFVGKNGAQAAIPRAFLNRYPMILATQRNGRSLGEEGSFYSVARWTSKPKLLEESLPVANYFVPALERIELTNYQYVYAGYFLKNRSDPRAVRGERLFVQTCMGCHTHESASAQQRMTPRSLVSNRVTSPSFHSKIKGMPKLENNDRKALERYFKAAQSSNSALISRPPLANS